MFSGRCVDIVYNKNILDYYSIFVLLVIIPNVLYFKNIEGSNGDSLIGDWQATKSGIFITCVKNQNQDNTYVCSWGDNSANVVWKTGKYVWNDGTITGTISSGESTQAILTWSTGSKWKKVDIGTFGMLDL